MAEVLQLQHRFVGGQKQPIAGAARQKLDRSSGLTLVRLEEQRQRERRRRKRLVGGRAWLGGSLLGGFWSAGFGGMYSGSKIKHDACGGEHGRRQKRSLHPISCLFLLSPNVSPNLLPTQGNSDSRSSSDFPISWGENKNGTQTPLRLDALGKRMRTCHQKLGLNQTNTFTSNRYAVKPGRQHGPHSEKPKERQMVVKKRQVQGSKSQVSEKPPMKPRA